MNHRPIVISEDGFKAMNISADFAKYAREHGIRDPFEVSRQLFSKRCHRNEDGSHSVDIEWDEGQQYCPQWHSQTERSILHRNVVTVWSRYWAKGCFLR